MCAIRHEQEYMKNGGWKNDYILYFWIGFWFWEIFKLSWYCCLMNANNKKLNISLYILFLRVLWKMQSLNVKVILQQYLHLKSVHNPICCDNLLLMIVFKWFWWIDSICKEESTYSFLFIVIYPFSRINSYRSKFIWFLF